MVPSTLAPSFNQLSFEAKRTEETPEPPTDESDDDVKQEAVDGSDTEDPTPIPKQYVAKPAWVDDVAKTESKKLPPAPLKLHEANLKIFASTLPIKVQMHLNPDIQGRPNPNLSFTSELTPRHLIPTIVDHGMDFLHPEEQQVLYDEVPLFKQYLRVRSRYKNVNPSAVRGFQTYENADDETEINTNRVHLMSAALFHLNLNVPTLVNYIGGPHTAAHRDHQAMYNKLAHINENLRHEWFRRVTMGAPQHCKAHSTDENFRAYLHYGNHSTCTQCPDVFQKVTVKDFKRGNTILVDPELLPFIPNLHLTPQGIVDIDNKYKPPRPIYDSTFRPRPQCEAINDWVDPSLEGDITFIRSIQRIARAIWNMRISYPNEPIYIGDDDVSNAFRLVKIHPTLVGMHGFQVNDEYLGFCTGMTFGDNCSPANFDIFAVGEYKRKKNARLDLTRRVRRLLSVVPYLIKLQCVSIMLSTSGCTIQIRHSNNRQNTSKICNLQQKGTIIYLSRKHKETLTTPVCSTTKVIVSHLYT